jgi:NAD(P)-dependent dehydrogenase (short-subunit alcohol dehydrogenase family)
MNRLAGKAVVVTGTGSGLGRSYAIHAARHGARVLLNDLDTSAEAAAAAIRATGGSAVALAGDVADWSFGEALVGACVERFGRIDGLVNNAGVLRHGRATDLREADMRRMLEVNTMGTAACGSAAIRAMLRQGGGGSIVNVASGSQAGDIALGGYAASKAAVAALTFSWALELAETPVRVNAVSPLAATAMAASNTAFLAQQSAAREVVYTDLPSPEVNAPVIVHLLSDRSATVRGQIVRIAGRELSFVTHPMIARPVLTGVWDDEAVERAFAEVLDGCQQRLGLGYERAAVN